MFLWPVFFISAIQPNAHLKARNFRKSVVKGTEHAKSVASSAPTFGALSAQVYPRREADIAPNMLEEEDVRPAWDTATTNDVSFGIA